MSAVKTLEIASVQDRVSPEEWRVRVELAATYRLIAANKWDDLIFTHLSVRVPGPEHHFLINPYGLMFEEITASSLVKIDVDGNIVDETEFFVNPAGFTIHSAIHMAREDAHAVLHLHTDDGVAVSSQDCGLLPANQQALTVYSQIAYHEYEGIAVDLDERERLVADLGNRNVMILRNHGTLTVGRNCAAAYLRMYLLERACAMQVKALAIGGPERLAKLPDGMIERVAEQAKMDGQRNVGELAWPALLRWLDRRDPSYRT